MIQRWEVSILVQASGEDAKTTFKLFITTTFFIFLWKPCLRIPAVRSVSQKSRRHSKLSMISTSTSLFNVWSSFTNYGGDLNSGRVWFSNVKNVSNKFGVQSLNDLVFQCYLNTGNIYPVFKWQGHLNIRH